MKLKRILIVAPVLVGLLTAGAARGQRAEDTSAANFTRIYVGFGGGRLLPSQNGVVQFNTHYGYTRSVLGIRLCHVPRWVGIGVGAELMYTPSGLQTPIQLADSAGNPYAQWAENSRQLHLIMPFGLEMEARLGPRLRLGAGLVATMGYSI